MKVAIVILNWNGRDFLERFLPGLVSSVAGRNDTEIFVADNGSSDGSSAWLEEKHPEVKVIRFDRNYGFTGGYNRALNSIEAQYYLLLNSDIEVTDGWLDPLVEWMDTHYLCGACAPKLRSYSDRENFEYAGAAGGYIDRYGYPFCRGRVLGKTEKDYGQYDEPAEVMWVSGACMMVRDVVFRKLGGFDERFFAHMEEIDLCWRIQLDGYRVMVIPESVVYHIGGGTLPASSPWKLFLNYRNNLLMLGNNLAATYALTAYNSGQDTDSSAMEGIRRARRTIRTRLALDLASAAVYLVTFRFSYFRSVIRAHREFRKMVSFPSGEDLERFLEDNGKIADVTGIYSRWIVLRSILYGKDIFRRIRTEMN